MTRYFRHLGVDPVRLADGRMVAFKTVDGVQSFLGTQDPALWSGFEQCMRENRSGLTEIDYATFDSDYLQKKSNSPPLKAPWREEVYKGRLMPSTSVLDQRLSQLPAAVAANPPPPPAPEVPAALSQAAPQATVNAQIAKELPKAADYKPEVGKRRKAKAA